MWTLTALLWAVAAAGPTAPGPGCATDCAPSIRLNSTGDGGRTLLLTKPAAPHCRCHHLDGYHQPAAGPDGPRQADWCRHRMDHHWDVPGLPADPEQRLARVTVHLGGWYFAFCREKDGARVTERSGQLYVEGFNYSSWNVTISATQLPGDPARLKAAVTQQMDPSRPADAPPLFFPELRIQLFGGSPRSLVGSGRIGYPKNNSYVFGGDDGLAPGEYQVEVRPQHVYCSGSCQTRSVVHTVVAPPERPSVGRVAADTAGRRTLYLVLGLLAGLALVSLAALLSYRLLFGPRGRRWLETVGPQKAPGGPWSPAAPVSVLLLYRGGGGEGSGPAALDQLRAALRGAGFILRDSGERSVLNALQTFTSPAELLSLEAFSEAHLLFVGDGVDSVEAPNSVPAQVYDNVLKFVRNGRLGLDYRRVFAATLGDSAGGELTGLVEGRLFRIPADLAALVDHMQCARCPPPPPLCSQESRVDLLPADGGSEGTEPGPRPSVAV